MSKHPLLERVRIALGIEEGKTEEVSKITFAAEATLADGTVISADAFEAGNPLFIVAADGTATPATPGDYETADLVITVDESGNISNVTPVTPAEEETKVEEAAVETAVDPEIATLLQAITDKLVSIEDRLTALEGKTSETAMAVEKFSKAPATVSARSIALKSIATEELTKTESRINFIKGMRKK